MLWQARQGLIAGRAAIDAAPAAGGGATTTFDPADKGTSQDLTLGNLKVAHGAGGDGIAHTVAVHSTGKYYCEVVMTALANTAVGVFKSGMNVNTYLTDAGNGGGTGYNGASYVGPFGGTTSCPVGGPVNNGHLFAFAVDIDNRLMWIKDITAGGLWNVNASADPATGVNGATMTGLLAVGNITFGVGCNGASDSITANFGATAYTGTPPAGFGNW